MRYIISRLNLSYLKNYFKNVNCSNALFGNEELNNTKVERLGKIWFQSSSINKFNFAIYPSAR